ncbi:MAG: glutathione S-transferase C-terminal domain-containing protein [Burkholderiales bacterium]|jgi:glutathione S-transferase
MKLIGSDGSPYVRKVRVVLAEKKIDYRFEREDVWSSQTTIGESNPLGKVPTLITEDGAAVFDSRVIVEYLDTVSPLQRLIPPSGRSRVEVRCWEALCDGLLDAAILARLENNRPDPATRSASWIARQMGKIDASLEAMAKGLGDKPYCCEGKYSLADVALGCALGYLDFRFPQIDWRARHPNLERHAAKLLARPAFVETAPKG